jgi:hypothetical protein
LEPFDERKKNMFIGGCRCNYRIPVLIVLLVQALFGQGTPQALFGQGTPQNATPAANLQQLADEKMQVSKLDWILLVARVRELEQVVAHESSRPVSLVGMKYDSDKKLVVASAFVDPSWIDSAKIEVVRKLLPEQAGNYCVMGFMLAYGDAGGAALLAAAMAAPTGAPTDCSVRFFTWDLDKAGQITVKDVATFEGGRLILK